MVLLEMIDMPRSTLTQQASVYPILKSFSLEKLLIVEIACRLHFNNIVVPRARRTKETIILCDMSSILSQRLSLTKEEIDSLRPKEFLHGHLDVLGTNSFAVQDSVSSQSPSTISRRSGYATDEEDNNWLEESAVAPAHLLEALDEIIESMPFGKKAFYLEAVMKCPQLVNDVHKTAFLIRDKLNEEFAAKRLVEYWALRKYVFGPERCYLPLTLAGALRDDVAAIASSFISILPNKDTAGRTVILFNWGNLDPAKFSISTMVRAMWYVLHAANEDPLSLEKGIVIVDVFNPRDCHFMSDGFADGRVDFLNVAPFIVRGHHFCSIQANFPRVLSRTITLLSASDKLRARGHNGTRDIVCSELERYGLPRDSMPIELGGAIQVDQNKWLVDRMIVELPTAPYADVLPGFVPPQRYYGAMVSSSSSGMSSSLPPTMNNGVVDIGTYGSMRAGPFPVNLRRGPNPERARPRVRGPGCKGDERMDRAVQAKMDNPDLSLLSALQQGGFDFDKYDQPDTQVLDSAGITLSQRKNQLNRRLRKSKQLLKEKEEKEQEEQEDGTSDRDMSTDD